MSTYAQVEHVEALRPRPFAPVEVEHVQYLVDRAEREVARHVDVAARIAAGRLTVDGVRDAVVDIVLRVIRNPGGVRSQSSGPFSQVVDASVASGRIELTRADRRALGMTTGPQTVPVVDPALHAPAHAPVVSTSGLLPWQVLP